MSPDDQLSDLGTAACSIAENFSFRVHPCDGKKPILADWPALATTDLEVVENWWKKYPNASIGIATGKESNLAVLDVDDDAAFDEWCQKNGFRVPETPIATTPSGGRHYFFRYPPNVDSVANRVRFIPGCDLRGDGGNVIAPVGEGRGWVWHLSPDDISLAPFPVELLSYTTKHAAAREIPEKIPQGWRNNTLASLAASMRNRGATEKEILSALLVMNRDRCTPSLGEGEVRGIARSYGGYPLPERPQSESDQKVWVPRVVTLTEFDQTEIPERELVMVPWLHASDLGMVHAWRGTGKTIFSLAVGLCIAAGSPLIPGRWTVPRPRRVLYVDGELPFDLLKKHERAVRAALDIPTDIPFDILTRDTQQDGRWLPTLDTPEGRASLEAAIQQDTALVILDNLSCLAATAENDDQAWIPVQQLLLDLRHRGIAVLLIHHSGKGGLQRGTSRREDVLDIVLNLKRPSGCLDNDPARFEVRFEKSRAIFGAAVTPVELELTQDDQGLPTLASRTLDESRVQQVADFLNRGWKNKDIAEEMDISKGRVSQLSKQAKEKGLLNGD